jgi:hypothetical protein
MSSGESNPQPLSHRHLGLPTSLFPSDIFLPGVNMRLTKKMQSYLFLSPHQEDVWGEWRCKSTISSSFNTRYRVSDPRRTGSEIRILYILVLIWITKPRGPLYGRSFQFVEFYLRSLCVRL